MPKKPIKLFTSLREHPIFTPQVVLVLVIVVLFALTMIWSSAGELMGQTPTHTPVPYILTPNAQISAPTLFPPEFYTNYDQANGILVGGIFLVLIVIGGTLAVIRKK